MIDVAFSCKHPGGGGGLTWVITLANYLQSQGLTVQVRAPKIYDVAREQLAAAGIEFVKSPGADAKVVLDSGGGVVPRAGGKLICVRHSRRTWQRGWVEATRAADEIVAVSLPVAANTKKVTGRTPVVINNGVDVKRLDRVGEDLRETLGCEFLLGFVGRNIELKNAKTVSAAARQMHEYAIMVGADVPGDKRLQSEWTRLMGYTVTPGDVYRAADIICVPSAHEAFPFTVIEALCMGRRVVVSAMGCCKEFADMVTRIPPLKSGRRLPAVDDLVEHIKVARVGPAPDMAAARERFGLPVFYRKWLELLERYL